MFGVERAGAVGADQFVRDQRPDVIVAKERQGIELVRGPEAVEEMEERHARLKRRRLRDQCRIMGFLYVGRGNEREAGGSGGHDVGMVAKDRQRRRGERPCRDMKHRWGQLPGYLEHVGQHQHQPLRGGEGRGHRSGLQRAMDSAGGPSLALHLLHLGDVPPDVLETFGRPLVGQFSHGR